MLLENEDDTFALYALGMEFEGNNEPDEALHYFNRVLLIEPAKVPVYYRLGTILYAKGLDADAVKILKSGLELLQKGNNLKTRNEFLNLIQEIEFG